MKTSKMMQDDALTKVDRPDEDKSLPLKKRVRLLSSDESNEMSLDADYDDRNFIDAGDEENQAETFLIENISSDNGLLIKRPWVGDSVEGASGAGSAGKQAGEMKEVIEGGGSGGGGGDVVVTEHEGGGGGGGKDGRSGVVGGGEQVEETMEVMEHDGGGGGGGNNNSAPDGAAVDGGKQADDTKEVIEHGGGGGVNDAEGGAVGGVKQAEETEEVIEHDGGGGGGVNDTEGGAVGDVKQADDTMEVIEHDGGGSGGVNDAEGGAVGGVKQAEETEELIEHDGDAGGGVNDGEGGVVGDVKQAEETKNVTENGGGGDKSAHDGGSNYAPDVVDDEKQVQGVDTVTVVQGSSSHSTIGTIVEFKNGGKIEGEDHEGQVAAMLDAGGDEIMRNSETVEEGEINEVNYLVDDVVSMIDDGEQVPEVDPVTNLEDHYEQGKEAAIEEDGDGSGGVIAHVVEDQDRKGKKPMDYVVCTTVHGGIGARKEGESSDNAPVFGGVGEHLNQDDPPTNPEGVLSQVIHHEGSVIGEVEPEGSIGDVGNVGSGRSTDLAIEIGIGAHTEGNHDDLIQQAAFEVPDGGSGIDTAAAPGGGTTNDTQIQHNPMTVTYGRKRQSSQELGSLSQDGGSGDAPGPEARKKLKHGKDAIGESSSIAPRVDGSSGSIEPSVLGVNIPCEENEVPVIHRPMRMLRLFGVDIAVPLEEVQPPAAGTGDGSSLTNQASDGVSLSAKRPKLGLRLMGFDL